MIALCFALMLDLSLLADPEIAYREGRYEEALEGWRARLDAQGPGDGSVLYDMGNCAWRLGRDAQARLHYERARLRMPRDEQLLFNLGLVEDRLGVEARATGLGTGAPSFTPGEVLSFGAALQAIGLIGFVLLRRLRRGRMMAGVILVAGLACVLFAADRHFRPPPPGGVILADQATLVSDDGGAAVALRAGEWVVILETSGERVLVSHDRGRGWVDRSDVGTVD